MYTSIDAKVWIGFALALCLTATASADEADEAYALAAGHYSQGRWSLAEQEFASFLERHPSDSRRLTARLFQAESQVQQGQHNTAKRGFREFLRLAPDHRFAGHATFRIAEAAYLAGDSRTAELELRDFCERFPDDPMNAYALNYRGGIALAADDSRRAGKWYTEAVRRFPKGPLADESRFGLARALELQGDHESALVAYRIVVAGRGRLADDAQLQIGISQYNRGQFDKATEGFAATIKNFPDSDRLAIAKYWLGMSQIARSQWGVAVATLTEAAESHPDHALTGHMLFWLGEAYRSLGDAGRATHCYAAVTNDWPDSEWGDDSLQRQIQLAFTEQKHDAVIELVEVFERLYPESSLMREAQRALSRSLLKQQRYTDAVAVLQELVVTEQPASDNSSPEALAGVLSAAESAARRADFYYLGIAYLGVENYALALEALSRVYPSGEEQALQEGLWVAQATAMLATDRCAQAIDPLKKYLAVQPSGMEASKCRVYLMVALARSGRFDEALQTQNVLTETDRRHESYLPALNRLAEAIYEAGRYDAATRLFTIVTEESSSDEQAAEAWSGLGWAHFSSGNLESAAEAFGKVATSYSDSELAPEAAMMQAKTLEQMDRPEEAASVYEVVSTAFATPEHAASALFESARLKEQLGEMASAVEILERIIEEHPQFAQMDAVLYQLAWLRMDAGQTELGVASFQQLIETQPSSPYRADSLYRLAEHAARAQQPSVALQFLDQIIQEKGAPDIFCHALYLKGQLAASQERWQDVLPPMQTIVDEFPNASLTRPAQYWIAEAHFQLGEDDSAFEGFSVLQKTQSEDRGDWLAMVALRHAQLLATRKQWRAAYDAANAIRDRYPEFRQQYEADYITGRCLAMQAKFSEARTRYEQVIRSPEGGGTETAAMAQWMIGETYMHQQNFDEALRAFYRVESLFAYPHWRAAALLQAGKCHAHKGETEQAAKLFAQVAAEHSESPFAKEASQRLRDLDANRTLKLTSTPRTSER